MQITDDLTQLLDIVPDDLRKVLREHPQLDTLIEIVLDLGRRPEARFPSGAAYLAETPVTREHLNYCIERVGSFTEDNRAGIEQTLHRISAMRNRSGEVVGLTCRVGRAVFGTIGMIRDLVETGQSILLLGRPGVGKTTVLREIARVLADDFHKRVVIIDTSNEIAGDGDIPHPAIGRARRMQVARPELQHRVMIEAVENHTPEVIVIDEIGTELEALAARTIAERGVQLVGTAHGNKIENLVKNPTLCDLIGGIQAVTLGDDEARRRGSQKTVLERKAPPTFEIAIEMQERQRWVIHEQVALTVDQLLRGRLPNPQVRTLSETGEILSTPLHNQTPANPPASQLHPVRGSRSTWEPNRKFAVAPTASSLPTPPVPVPPSPAEFERLLDASLSQGYDSDLWEERTTGPNGEDLPLHVYPYGIARHHVEQVIETLGLPVVITKNIDTADVVLALRSHSRNQSKIRQISKTRKVPLHTIKANTMPKIAKALRRLLDMEDPSTPEIADFTLFLSGSSEDEMEALEEARLAVEQIVIPQGQPVELLPRSPKVRKMQHELVEHYRLKSTSFGDEPNRRLRIYPA